MASFSVGANCFLSSEFKVRSMGPHPTTVRGAAVHLNAHPKEPRIIYPSGKFIVVKNLEDPTDCFIYRGHGHQTTVAKFSPNGFWVASADTSGKVRVWSWDNPEHLTKLETVAFAGSVLDLDWDSESKKIIAVGEGAGSMAKVFNWDTGNSAGEIVGHNKRIISCAFKPSRPFRIFTASEDMRTIMYAGPPFKLDHSNPVHTNFVNCVRYSPDGSRVVSVGSDKKIQMYDGTTGEPTLATTDAHAGSIYSVAFSPNGTLFATASADKTVKIWEAATLACIHTIHFSEDPQVGDMQVAVLWCNYALLSLSLNGNFNILSVESPVPKYVIQDHQTAISAMALAEGDVLFTGSSDGVVCRRSLAGGHTVRMASQDKRAVNGGAHSNLVTGLVHHENELRSVGWDDVLRFADTTTNAYFDSIPLGSQPTALAAPTPYNGLSVVVTNSEVIVFRDREIAAKVTNLSYSGLCAAMCGEEVAVGGSDNRTHIYHLSNNNTTLTEVKTIETRSPVSALAYGPHGDVLAIGDHGRQVEVYERGTWAERIKGRWVNHTSRVTTLAWSPTGSHLASGSLDESLILWNLASPSTLKQVHFAHTGGVTGVVWRSNEELVSCGNDHVIVTWRFRLE